MAVASCGGLKFNSIDFHIVKGILTTKATTTVSNYFVADYCGGIKFDSAIFKQVVLNGKNVITLSNGTPTGFIVANCSILFDGAKFELNNASEICLK